jgi:hypothetical protein
LSLIPFTTYCESEITVILEGFCIHFNPSITPVNSILGADVFKLPPNSSTIILLLLSQIIEDQPPRRGFSSLVA